MLGLGLGLAKGNFISNFAKSLYKQYVVRVTAAGGVFQNAVCALNRLLALNSQSLLKQASWVLIPDGIEEDIVFAQKPTSGLGDLNFQRASDATYTDSTGVVRRSPYNLFTFSEDFTNVAWTKINSTVTANVTTAPNGTLTADKLALIAGINPLISDGTGLTVNQTITSGIYTYSIYLKAAERNIARWRDGGLTGQYLVVNLTDGTFTNGAPARFQNVQVISAGDGWYRVQFTTGTITNSNVYPLRFGDTGQTGDGTSGGFVWGAQLVEGTSALDYFPTTNRQDVPRIDFRNADGTLSSCGRLLLEPQRTNSFLQSESFDNAGWSKNACVVTANATTAPDGTLTAEKLIANSGYDPDGGFGNLTQTNTIGSAVYTFSLFAKSAEFTSVRFRETQLLGQLMTVNLTNGAISGGGSQFVNPQAVSVGNGWFRISFTTSAAITNANKFIIRVADTGDGTSGIFIWGAQLEAGAYATTYIPTTTAAVTRLADAASKTGVSSLIGQTEGTLFAEVNIGVWAASNRVLAVSDGTTDNAITLLTGPGANTFRLINRTAGALNVSIVSSTISGTNFKIAAGYANNDYVLYVNGVQIGTDTIATVPACSVITAGKLESAGNGNELSGGLTQAALFPTRLSNAELAQLTTL